MGEAAVREWEREGNRKEKKGRRRDKEGRWSIIIAIVPTRNTVKMLMQKCIE